MSRLGVVVRIAGVVAAVGALGATAATLARAAAIEAARLWAGRDHLNFDDLVLAGALAILAVAALWLTLAVSLTAATECLRCTQGTLGTLAALITPRACRTLLRGACGAAVLVAPAGAVPALAAAAEAPHAVTHPVRHPVTHPVTNGCATPYCAGDLSGLPLPDRPSTATAQTAPRVVVEPGDTLWAIAASHLPPQAPDDAIAAAWPVWFDTNRARIGPDPDLIHPRSRLVVPARFRPDDKDR